MGFGDFLSKAIGAVGNLVSHSPIVKSLAPLAGIISHAVPIVGPIIDNAIPAIEAIFSKDSTSPNPGEDPKPPTDEQLSAPVLIELKRQEGDIKAILQAVQSIKTDLDKSLKELSDDLSSKLELTATQIKDMFADALYDQLYTIIQSAAVWIENHQSQLKVTAQDGPDKFGPLLVKEGNLIEQRIDLQKGIASIETNITNSGKIPAQRMLDLYLLGVHWLLIYDKSSIIVTRGIEARSLYVEGQQWKSYLESVNNLTNDIDELRHDAIRARNVLGKLIDRISKDREKSVNIVGEGETTHIQDDWPIFSVGWMPLPGLRTALGLPESIPFKSYNGLVIGNNSPNIVLLLWKVYARQAVEFSLDPARAVMNHLEDNIRQWNSRVPVGPTKNLPTGKQHIAASVVSEKDSKSLSLFLKDENFVGRKIKYALTYCNTYGESYSSGWSKQCDIEEETYAVKINLHPIKFDNDPLADLPLITGPDDTAVEPQRSIRRKLYVRYIEDHGKNDVVIYLGEVGEHEEVVYHEFQQKQPEGSKE
ncbi:hypothetical protein BDV19DRAFT_365609 [Aspergillus venezuelensis]